MYIHNSLWQLKCTGHPRFQSVSSRSGVKLFKQESTNKWTDWQTDLYYTKCILSPYYAVDKSWVFTWQTTSICHLVICSCTWFKKKIPLYPGLQFCLICQTYSAGQKKRNYKLGIYVALLKEGADFEYTHRNKKITTLDHHQLTTFKGGSSEKNHYSELRFYYPVLYSANF